MNLRFGSRNQPAHCSIRTSLERAEATCRSLIGKSRTCSPAMHGSVRASGMPRQGHSRRVAVGMSLSGCTLTERSTRIQNPFYPFSPFSPQTLDGEVKHAVCQSLWLSWSPGGRDPRTCAAAARPPASTPIPLCISWTLNSTFGSFFIVCERVCDWWHNTHGSGGVGGPGGYMGSNSRHPRIQLFGALWPLPRPPQTCRCQFPIGCCSTHHSPH